SSTTSATRPSSIASCPSSIRFRRRRIRRRDGGQGTDGPVCPLSPIPRAQGAAMDRLGLALAAVVGVPLLTCGYIVAAEKLLGVLPGQRQRAIRPWLWLAPALALLLVFLVYPIVQTIVLSLDDASSTHFVGLQN